MQRLYRAKKSLLQAVNDTAITGLVPSHLKDDENFWFGITKKELECLFMQKIELIQKT